MTSDAVVDVWDEPHHHRLFQNAFAQVMSGHVPARATTMFHRHVVDGIPIPLADYTVEDQRLGEEEWTTRTSTVGRVGGGAPRVHRFRNVGSTDQRFVDVELVRPAGTNEPAFVDAGLELATEFDKARAYKLSFGSGESTGALSSEGPALFVAVTDGVVRLTDTRTARVLSWLPGAVLWEESLQQLQIENMGEAALLAVIVQLR